MSGLNMILSYDPLERMQTAETNYWDDGLAVQIGTTIEVGKWLLLKVSVTTVRNKQLLILLSQAPTTTWAFKQPSITTMSLSRSLYSLDRVLMLYKARFSMVLLQFERFNKGLNPTQTRQCKRTVDASSSANLHLFLNSITAHRGSRLLHHW